MLRELNIGDHFGKIAQLQKNPNNMKRGEERRLSKIRISKVWKKNHYTQMAGIMVHRPTK